MRLQDIYRVALARGLTAKEAGAEFGVNPASISKMKTRHGFPPLIHSFEREARVAISKMTDMEIQNYIRILNTTNKKEHKDVRFCMEELQKRKDMIPNKPSLMYDNIPSKNRRK